MLRMSSTKTPRVEPLIVKTYTKVTRGRASKTRSSIKTINRTSIKAKEKLYEKKQLQIAKTALKIAIAVCPTETGYLARSHSLIRTEDGWAIQNTCPYAKYVHMLPQTNIKHGKKAQWMQYAMKEAERIHSKPKT